MITMNVRKWIVSSIDTGAKASAPRTRPPISWYAYAAKPAIALPQTM